MKKETLIKLIDEEFGDAQEFSWLIYIFQRAIERNDNRITEATREYFERAKLVRDTLFDLHHKLVTMEKAELKNGVRILHKRPISEDK